MSQKSVEGFDVEGLRAKLNKIEVALNAIPEAIVWTDQFGHIDWCNVAFAALVGRDLQQLMAAPLVDVLPLQKLQVSATETDSHPIQRAVTNAPQGSDRYLLALADDQRRVLDVTWAYVDAVATASDRSVTTIILAMRDITQRHHEEAALRQQETRYVLAAQGANDGLWDWNLQTNEIYFSDRWQTMLGLVQPGAVTTIQSWFERVHPDDVAALRSTLNTHIQGETPHFQCEYRICHADGQYRWMLSRGLAVRDAQQRSYRIAGSQTDITDRKEKEAQLRYDALHDHLTGLPNRLLFQQRVAQAIQVAAAAPTEDLFAVLFLDLDRFKVINDSLGPRIGDQLLIEMARRINASLPPEHTLARMGGDEFAILLEHVTSKATTIAMVEGLQQAIAQPYQLEGHEVLTTASVGIMLSNAAVTDADDLIRNADIATHRAKKNGKAQYEVFERAMHTDAMTLLQLENDMRQAIGRHEFVVYYQPIMSLAHERLVGFEALIRWQHPRYGFISPGEFIPVAEDTGMIIPIGYWVLREACQQLQQWQTRYAFAGNPRPLTVSVNLSGRQFTQPDLVEQIEAILAETRLDAHSLKLEITESVIMNNAESAAIMLGKLQARGIQVSIDDFGTGYSSLSYLYQLPIDTLKIDRSFINSIDKDGEKLELVRTIVSLAWNLGMDVIAEGVETSMQLAQLKALRCECGQGFFFYKPLSPIEAEAVLIHIGHAGHDALDDDSTFIGI